LVPRISSESSYLTNPTNPNPSKFSVVKSIQIGNVFVSTVKYPNCTNYEGLKVIVSTFNPRQVERLDPHFTEDGGIIARFVPTQDGWDYAVKFAEVVL
jgi:hypothetical protein